MICIGQSLTSKQRARMSKRIEVVPAVVLCSGLGSEDRCPFHRCPRKASLRPFLIRAYRAYLTSAYGSSNTEDPGSDAILGRRIAGENLS